MIDRMAVMKAKELNEYIGLLGDINKFLNEDVFWLDDEELKRIQIKINKLKEYDKTNLR